MTFDPARTRIDPDPSDAALAVLLTEWLPAQRWFAAKDRRLDDVRIEARSVLDASLDDRHVEQVLIVVGSSSGPQRYQLWLGRTAALPDRLVHAVVGYLDDEAVYDALYDPAFSSYLLKETARGGQHGLLTFTPEPDAVFDIDALPMVIGAEQSNTSVVYGHTAILKVFRKIEPGPNPDAEIHRALHAAGSKQIAAPLGVISGPVAGEQTTLAMMTVFLAGSAEGWAMATASVRDLMAEADLRADEVGGDFAADARRLGQAVAGVHADLAAAFGTEVLDRDAVHQMVAAMTANAVELADRVPSLAANLDGIVAEFARAGSADAVVVQRIHGDLHLGQTLRALTGWAIIDFEGEPLKPLAFRRAKHSPLRDVAGMLRSFDYAARHSLAGVNADNQHLYRAAEWATRNRDAFLDGYASAGGFDPRSLPALLTAFELDKAVYEVAYEHGHRPAWEPIPLQAVVRLINPGGTS